VTLAQEQPAGPGGPLWSPTGHDSLILGFRPADVDCNSYDALGQRQVSTMYDTATVSRGHEGGASLCGGGRGLCFFFFFPQALGCQPCDQRAAGASAPTAVPSPRPRRVGKVDTSQVEHPYVWPGCVEPVSFQPCAGGHVADALPLSTNPSPRCGCPIDPQPRDGTPGGRRAGSGTGSSLLLWVRALGTVIS